jgi:hypothetical protein
VAVLPDETEQVVRLNGAVQCVAGSMLAMGWFPRLSAAVLAGTRPGPRPGGSRPANRYESSIFGYRTY